MVTPLRGRLKGSGGDSESPGAFCGIVRDACERQTIPYGRTSREVVPSRWHVANG